MSSAAFVSPEQANRLIEVENNFGYTMKRDGDLASYMNGDVYKSITPKLKALSTSKIYIGQIFTADWVIPHGAFGESCGPS